MGLTEGILGVLTIAQMLSIVLQGIFPLELYCMREILTSRLRTHLAGNRGETLLKITFHCNLDAAPT